VSWSTAQADSITARNPSSITRGESPRQPHECGQVIVARSTIGLLTRVQDWQLFARHGSVHPFNLIRQDVMTIC
jgi:hypothetical protein